MRQVGAERHRVVDVVRVVSAIVAIPNHLGVDVVMQRGREVDRGEIEDEVVIGKQRGEGISRGVVDVGEEAIGGRSKQGGSSGEVVVIIGDHVESISEVGERFGDLVRCIADEVEHQGGAISIGGDEVDRVRCHASIIPPCPRKSRHINGQFKPVKDNVVC